MKYILTISALLALGTLCRAQDTDLSFTDTTAVSEAVSNQETEVRKKGLIPWFQRWRDNSLIGGRDTAYVSVPEKKWMITTGLKTTQNGFQLYWPSKAEMTGEVDPEGLFGMSNRIFNHETKPTLGISIGISYKGFGLTVSPKVINNNDRNGLDLGLGLTGTTFGGDISLKAQFDSDNRDNHLLLLNGSLNAYYVLNNRKFNMTAAFSQSVMQKKSAGSVIFATMLDFASIIAVSISPKNPQVTAGTYGMHGNWSIGAGYGYNFVFAQTHCLIHASYIPMYMFLQGSEYGLIKENDETEKVRSDKRLTVPYSHMARFAFYYTWRERYLIGGALQDTHYGWLSSQRRPNASFEWAGTLFFKFRF